jgi:hypothetical protein
MAANGYRVSFWSNEDDLELNSTEGFTTLQIN